jgi:dTDP-glucose pyrophosphorylase
MEPELMSARLARVITDPDLSIADALARLEEAGTGMLLLARGDRRLVGVVTDGDIRRHILAGGRLEERCHGVANPAPLTGGPDTTPAEALALMNHGREFVVNQLPLIRPSGEIAELWLRSDFVTTAPVALSAVIMAGGYGTRLRPLTDDLPKPMLPVGDRPLLERTVRRLRDAGIQDVRVTTHYLGDRIASHFGDGKAFGVDITYLNEDRPLGTAGALALVNRPTGPLLVMNGDILTNLNFHALLAFHREHQADATVAVRKYDLTVPYGVLQCEGTRVKALQEKPTERFLVNAGIYLLEPTVLGCIPSGEHFDMTDLIQALLQQGRTVVSFPIVEYWLDIGRAEDYARAQADVETVRL